MARRSGADPPPPSQIQGQIQDQEDQAKRQQTTGAKKRKTGIPKNKQKQKGRPVKNKRRMSWHQAERREPSNYGHPDSPKRQRQEELSSDKKEPQGQPTPQGGQTNKRTGPTMEKQMKEKDTEPQTESEEKHTPSQKSQRREFHSPSTSVGEATQTTDMAVPSNQQTEKDTHKTHGRRGTTGNSPSSAGAYNNANPTDSSKKKAENNL